MKIWIDQDACTGDGLCEDLCKEMFFVHECLAYVKATDDPIGLGLDGQPKLKGDKGLAEVPKDLEEAVIEAAGECPGECIFIEVE